MAAPAAVNENPPASTLRALQSGSDLTGQAKITTHLILQRFDAEKRGLEVLHRDLFDANDQVVLSALEVLGAMKDVRSLRVIARLLTNEDETIQCAAVKAVGDIAHPKTAKVLLDLFKISKNENLRMHILEALAKITPGESGLMARIEEYAKSQLVKVETRRAATVRSSFLAR